MIIRGISTTRTCSIQCFPLGETQSRHLERGMRRWRIMSTGRSCVMQNPDVGGGQTGPRIIMTRRTERIRIFWIMCGECNMGNKVLDKVVAGFIFLHSAQSSKCSFMHQRTSSEYSRLRDNIQIRIGNSCGLRMICGCTPGGGCMPG